VNYHKLLQQTYRARSFDPVRHEFIKIKRCWFIKSGIYPATILTILTIDLHRLLPDLKPYLVVEVHVKHSNWIKTANLKRV